MAAISNNQIEINYKISHLKGNIPDFKRHFHEGYVIGLIKKGMRKMLYNDTEYIIQKGDIVIINPNDYHSCFNIEQKEFEFISIKFSKESMFKAVLDITQSNTLPLFSKNVVQDNSIADCILKLNDLENSTSDKTEKEELFYLLITHLLDKCSTTFKQLSGKYDNEIQEACDFINLNFKNQINLSDIAHSCLLSKSALIRAFVKAKGITPYLYLQNVRVENAKNYLKEGYSLLDTALALGFYDQSHFTNYFIRFVGISPRNYQNIFKRK